MRLTTNDYYNTLIENLNAVVDEITEPTYQTLESLIELQDKASKIATIVTEIINGERKLIER